MEVEKCPAARRLQTHLGVGALTALSFVLIIGRADRFQCGKQIASYLGLVPLEDSSGQRRRLGHITKQGNSLLRFLLVEAGRGYGPRIARFAMAVLGGAIPLLGGAVSGAGSAWSESEQDHFNRVAASWLQMQKDEIKEIGVTIAEILTRIDLNDENVRKRIESPEYLGLLKKSFRDWSAAESEEKRILIRNLLTNAAVNRICTDDVVRLFIQWIDYYSETHFKVIRHVYKNEGCTRAEMWQGIDGKRVREDSAEADLFKLLIHDLSTGHVVRQHRAKDYYGNYLSAANRVWSSAYLACPPIRKRGFAFPRSRWPICTPAGASLPKQRNGARSSRLCN
jgi:hypothetical protein